MSEAERVYLEKTADGSDTLFVPALNEHYHSVNGAIQESNHVFIEAGLKQLSKDNIKILEIGFGTGLNAFLTLLYAGKNNKEIFYTGLELYPLSLDLIQQLNYTQKLDESEKKLFLKMHDVAWGQSEKITNSFQLAKYKRDFSILDIDLGIFDLIYFDAFAPDKQSEMWTQDIFDYLYQHTSEGGILTTYCAKGIVRRMLQQSGYLVERLPGPPGKREMLRATKSS